MAANLSHEFAQQTNLVRSWRRMLGEKRQLQARLAAVEDVDPVVNHSNMQNLSADNPAS